MTHSEYGGRVAQIMYGRATTVVFVGLFCCFGRRAALERAELRTARVLRRPLRGAGGAARILRFTLMCAVCGSTWHIVRRPGKVGRVSLALLREAEKRGHRVVVSLFSTGGCVSHAGPFAASVWLYEVVLRFWLIRMFPKPALQRSLPLGSWGRARPSASVRSSPISRISPPWAHVFAPLPAWPSWAESLVAQICAISEHRGGCADVAGAFRRGGCCARVGDSSTTPATQAVGQLRDGLSSSSHPQNDELGVSTCGRP